MGDKKATNEDWQQIAKFLLVVDLVSRGFHPYEEDDYGPVEIFSNDHETKSKLLMDEWSRVRECWVRCAEDLRVREFPRC